MPSETGGTFAARSHRMTEDLDRQPDGVPHDIVLRTVFASCVLAAIAFVLVVVIGLAAAVIGVGAAVPVVVVALQRKAAIERDHVHPSR